jgi:beta-galactosidase
MEKVVRKLFLIISILIGIHASSQRAISNFNDKWKFFLGDDSVAREMNYDDSKWRTLNLPHDWSIEGEFSDKYPTTFNQGALPAGIGWYRKTFTLSNASQDKRVYIQFDGVYRNSEVWINGQYLGKRPNGYISFQYELSPYLKFGNERNIIAVRVDNSVQPNSRWYTGSGIYRSVRLVSTNKIAIDDRSVFLHTENVTEKSATVIFKANLINYDSTTQYLEWIAEVRDANGKLVTSTNRPWLPITIHNPKLWSPNKPNLYRGVVKLLRNKKVIDKYEITFGIRSIRFDVAKGFF